jgi:hypothetical protein
VALRGRKFCHAHGQASGALTKAGYCLLQLFNIFFYAQGAQMVEGVRPNQFVLRGLVSCRPQHSGRFIFAAMLRHLRR